MNIWFFAGVIGLLIVSIAVLYRRSSGRVEEMHEELRAACVKAGWKFDLSPHSNDDFGWRITGHGKEGTQWVIQQDQIPTQWDSDSIPRPHWTTTAVQPHGFVIHVLPRWMHGQMASMSGRVAIGMADILIRRMSGVVGALARIGDEGDMIRFNHPVLNERFVISTDKGSVAKRELTPGVEQALLKWGADTLSILSDRDSLHVTVERGLLTGDSVLKLVELGLELSAGRKDAA